jgi:hypothetical protein
MGRFLFLAGVLVDEAVMARFNRIINEFNCCSDDAWISSERDAMYKKLGSIEFKPKGFRVLDIASNSFLDIDIESYIECDYNINGLDLSRDALLNCRKQVRAFNNDSDCAIGFVPIICGDSLLEIDKTPRSDFRYITYASSTGFIPLTIKIDFINKKYTISYDSVKIVDTINKDDKNFSVALYFRNFSENISNEILAMYGANLGSSFDVALNIALIKRSKGQVVVTNGVTKIIMFWNTVYKDFTLVIPQTVKEFGVSDGEYELSLKNTTFYISNENKNLVYDIVNCYMNIYEFGIIKDRSIDDLVRLCSDVGIYFKFY